MAACKSKLAIAVSMYQFFITLNIWKVSIKQIDSTFSKLYYYACLKHRIMLEYYAQNYAGILHQGLINTRNRSYSYDLAAEQIP